MNTVHGILAIAAGARIFELPGRRLASMPDTPTPAEIAGKQQDMGVAEEVTALRAIIRDTLWMACRYAHGRRSYAVGMYNEAARRAVKLGAVEQGVETFAIDGSLSAEQSGLSQQEFAMAYHCWSSPNAIRTHIPRARSDAPNLDSSITEAKDGRDG
jgi:ABC-type xylose transport system permease subunit